MKRVCSRLSLLCLLLFVSVATAHGQATLPAENHYNVYSSVTPNTPYSQYFALIDEFTWFANDLWILDRWANPATKVHSGVTYPPVDPIAHQVWWRIYEPVWQPERKVVAIDQFGSTVVTLGNAVYLLNPALKNVPPPYPSLPLRNHYVCYEVIGALPVYQPVVIRDQFERTSVQVYQAKLFCSPVDMRDETGILVSPIIDARAHLQCYQIDPPNPYDYVLSAVDQFGAWQLQVYDNDCLCVPALKEEILGTKSSTWGQIKALYR